MIPILLYHKVSPPKECNSLPHLNVKPETFKNHLHWLKDMGYHGIRLSDAVDIVKSGKKPDEKLIVLTFDDGYKNNFDYAFPIGKELGFPLTIFISTNFIGSSLSFGAQKGDQILNKEELITLVKEGSEIGSHTCSHPKLSEIDEESALKELIDSKNILSEIVRKEVGTLAYPKGSYNQNILKLAEKAGYKCACTTKKGNRFSINDLMKLPRVKIHEDTTKMRLRFRLSVFYNI